MLGNDCRSGSPGHSRGSDGIDAGSDTPGVVNILGPCFDIHLNARAYWRNFPANVWNYKLGRLPGPQEVALLPGKEGHGPGPSSRRSAHFTDTARRMGAILELVNGS